MKNLIGHNLRHAVCAITASIGALSLSALPAAGQNYNVVNLVSDLPNIAQIQDPNLVNAWGLVSLQGGPWWVSDNGTGLSTLYDGQGNIIPLVVTVPPSNSNPTSTGTPTGIVGNATADFGGAAFIFDSEDGTISAWFGAAASVVEVDNGASAVYKGLANAQMGSVNLLYAANFRAGTIEAYDTNFHLVTLGPGAFTDPLLPAGYAPFNIQAVDNSLIVTFAEQDAAKHDNVSGPGLGYVDRFDTSGKLLLRYQHGTYLNAPWAVALAPSNFGAFSKDLLIGNFGSGHITAFDPSTGKVKGFLSGSKGNPILIPGLWALEFGQGSTSGPTNSLYFTAGIKGEAHGLFGSITAQ